MCKQFESWSFKLFQIIYYVSLHSFQNADGECPMFNNTTMFRDVSQTLYFARDGATVPMVRIELCIYDSVDNEGRDTLIH